MSHYDDYDFPFSPPPKKPIRKRIVARIPRNRRLTRAATHIVVGGAVGTGRVIRWVGIGTGRASRVVGKAAGRAGKVAGRKMYADVTRTLYGPSGPPVAGKRWRRTEEHTCVCGYSSGDRHAYAAHVTAHRDEARSTGASRKPEHVIVRATTRKLAGRVIVRPANWAPTGGRHRARRGARHKKKIDALMSKYRKRVNTIAGRQFRMGNVAKRISDAWIEVADQPVPKTLSDIREMMIDLERAHARSSDSVEDLGRMLKVKLNIDPRLVDVLVFNMKNNLIFMGESCTRFVASFEEFYAEDINEARRKLEEEDTHKPRVNLAK